MAALIIKVGALLLKTLAKPLSTRFQVFVMEHPVARKYAITASQKLHRVEVFISRSAEGKTGRAFVGDMTEEKSIELASKLAGESFVFSIGVLIVAFEYERQRRKDVVKKAQEAAVQQAVVDKASEERQRLARENSEQTALLQSLLHRVDSLEVDLKQLLDEAVRTRNTPKGMFGGFFSPRAQSGATSNSQ